MRLILLFSFFCVNVCAQSVYSDSVMLRITNDSLIYIDKSDTCSISFTIQNNSNGDIAIYGLKCGEPWSPFQELSEFCRVTGVGTGVVFALYHLDGKTERPELEIRDSWRRRPVTKRVVDSALAATQIDFLKSKQVLKKKSQLTFRKRLHLKNFRLEKELYYLQMVYYCGDESAKIIDVNEIQRLGQKLFHRCVISQKIPFVVKYDHSPKSPR